MSDVIERVKKIVVERLEVDAEKVIQGTENEAEQQARSLQSRVALRWAAGAVFAVYLVGATLQSWNIVWGLIATLWLVLLPLALLSVRGTASRAHESIGRALWLRLPHPLHALGAVLMAPGIVLAAQQFFAWQQKVLPMPSSQGDITLFPGAPGDHTLALLFVVAFSPAVCEELFFRGALLSGLRRDLPAWKVIAWEMLFFGAVHMSIYRFAPTAILGGVLAWITLRSRSLWPAVLLHGSYNGLLVLAGEERFHLEEEQWWMWAAAAVLGVLLVARTGEKRSI
jgi:sodium transport system permease protein